jgi:hypothetical protein
MPVILLRGNNSSNYWNRDGTSLLAQYFTETYSQGNIIFNQSAGKITLPYKGLYHITGQFWINPTSGNAVWIDNETNGDRLLHVVNPTYQCMINYTMRTTTENNIISVSHDNGQTIYYGGERVYFNIHTLYIY